MNDLIRVKLKEILNLVNTHYPLFFLRDIHEGHLSREKADNKQSNFANELKIFQGTKNL